MDHHYLPQFYLREWCSGGATLVRYWRTPKGVLDERSVSPKGTAFEPGLYATPPHLEWERYDPDIIETEAMSPIDNDAARVHRKVVDGNLSLTDDERKAWALFLNSLLHRHRDGVLERDKRAPEVAYRLLDDWMKRYDDDSDGRARVIDALRNVDLAQMSKTAHRTIMVQTIRGSGGVSAIAGMAWAVLQREVPLITTDRPLLLVRNDQDPRAPAVMSIAIAPNKLFVGYPRQWLDTAGTVANDARQWLAQLAFGHDLLLLTRQPCRYVYASRRLDDECPLGDRKVRLRAAVDEALARWASEQRGNDVRSGGASA